MILKSGLFCRHCDATKFVVTILFLFCAASADAQVSRVGGTLSGVVSDTTGAVIPNAKVVLHNPLSNQSRSVNTDEQGFFRAEQLAVGTYEVKVEQAGFAPYRHTGVQVSLGQTVSLDIVLVPASSSPSVIVSAQPSVMDTSQTSVVSSIDQERIQELPKQK